MGGESKPRILIIDRDSGMRPFVRLALGDQYEVHQAFSGTLAMALLRREHYDFVLASTDMPAGSGYRGPGIIKKIRSITGYQDCPIVALVPEDATGASARTIQQPGASMIRKGLLRGSTQDSLRAAMDRASTAGAFHSIRPTIARPLAF